MKDVLLVSGGDPSNIFEEIRQGMTSFTDLTFDAHNAVGWSFKYKNFGQRAYNFFRKNLSGKNIKDEFYDNSVKRIMDTLETRYEKILIMRPDLLSDHHLRQLKEKTNCFIAYYWDTVDYAPRKRDIVHFFDRILSFDPGDCKTFGFEFKSNFYCYENQASETRYQVYNLSSFDYRIRITEEIAMVLEDLGMSYLFKGFKRTPFKNSYIQYTQRITHQQMLNEECIAM
jgi:hypothetical protein